LGRKVWRVKKGQSGSVFYIEWGKGDESPEEWLAKIHRKGLISFAPPLSLSGPLAGFSPGKPPWEGAQIYGIGTRRS
jgi:hypothetical protein